MGCASSAALPFLTTKEHQAVVDTPSLNGKTTYELPAEETVKDIDESFVSEKMKEVVDSSAVQGVIGGVVQAKDNLVHQVKDVGDAITGKVSSTIHDVEETIDSTFDKITGTIGAAEEKVKSGIEAVEGEVKSLLGGGGSNEKIADSIKAEDIDELLNALPAADEEVTTEEVIKQAVEEVQEEEAEEATEN